MMTRVMFTIVGLRLENRVHRCISQHSVNGKTICINTVHFILVLFYAHVLAVITFFGLKIQS